MNYLGDFAAAAVFDFKFTSRRFSTGAPFALASGAISIYKDNNTTQTTTGVTLSADFDGVTGLNNVHIDTADAFYAAGSNFQAVITTGTVDSVSVVGEVVAEFSIVARPLQSIGASVITATSIATDAIGAAEIADGAITAATFAAGAIDATAIANGAIDAATFAADAITATVIADGAIDAATFATGAITAAAIATDAIGAAEIADGAITAATFAAGAIDATAIAAGAIDAATFAAGAIDAAAIADGAIDAATFAAGAITAAAIATDAIGAAEIADGAITAATFAAGAIDATAIANGAIDAATFAAGAIDAAAIADGAIDAATFAANAITATVIADGAIDAATFAAGAITATVIADGAIDAATFAAGAITATVVADGAIDAATFAAGAITAAAIADAAIDRATFAVDTGLQTIRSNTAQAGGATTITLDASASAVDDFYNNDLILLTGGTGVGGSRFISDYDGTTKVATVAAWATAPDNTTTFAILPFDAVAGATAPTAAQVATAVWQDATAGDFTAASSIGRSLYTAGALPGAAGGHFIAGTNAATVITTSLTTTFTGNLTGSVGSVTGNVGGNVTGTVGSVVGAVGSVTGNVGGNVVGSVGSVAGLTFTVANLADVNVLRFNGVALGAQNISKTTSAIGRGTVGAASTTTSIVTSAFVPNGAAADQFKGRIVTFDADTTTTALRGQATDITASSNAAAPVFTVTALTTAPVSGDTFSVT